MKRITLVWCVLLWAVVGSSAAIAQDPLQGALENNRTNQASTWVNPDTGDSGTVVPVRTYENGQGRPCREFQRTIIIGGREEQGYGTACRQTDGTWRIVAGQTAAAAPVEQRTTVYVREAPRPYYPYYPYYPYGYYAPWGYGYPYWYPFSFSLGYVYYDGGHRHGGGHHHGSWHRSGGGHWSGGGHKGGGHRGGGGGHRGGGQWSGGGRHR